MIAYFLVCLIIISLASTSKLHSCSNDSFDSYYIIAVLLFFFIIIEKKNLNHCEISLIQNHVPQIKKNYISWIII